MSGILHDLSRFAGITQDSRAVKRGYLFAALPGSRTDGRNFIDKAIYNGATGVLAPEGTELPDIAESQHVTLYHSSNPARDLSLIAAAFYGQQPEFIAAVTGTNGKTSVADFCRQFWLARNLKAASIGTLGLRGPSGQEKAGSMTTPDPVSLHAQLADLAAAGVSHLAMEASSHGLDQYRLDGVRISAAGFTNFTRDHLDYHGGMEEYFRAKLRLFSEVVRAGGTAVLNADIPEYDSLRQAADSRGLRTVNYGFAGKDLKVEDILPVGCGQQVKASMFGRSISFLLPLVGGFQTINVFCALGLVLSESTEYLDSAVSALEHLRGVPGRLQLVEEGRAASRAVYIDYAHTPDALETVLKALRPHTKGRLVCLFGCGGDRDSGKRPMMGAIAGRLADSVIVTDDNPRSENPAEIRRQIMAGVPGVREIAGRREAIGEAVQSLRPDDVLLVAGKGHEQGQIFATHTDPFDDYAEAANAAGQAVAA